MTPIPLILLLAKETRNLNDTKPSTFRAGWLDVFRQEALVATKAQKSRHYACISWLYRKRSSLLQTLHHFIEHALRWTRHLSTKMCQRRLGDIEQVDKVRTLGI